MIRINGIWESVKDIDDLFRIVAENIGYEFAYELKRVCDRSNENLEETIYSLECEIEDLESINNDLDDVAYSLENLKDQIDELRGYIVENDDGSDFIRGMKKALGIVE